MIVNDVGTDAPSGFDNVFAIVNVPRSFVIEFATVNVNVPDVLEITIDDGVTVGVPHVYPVIGVNAASDTVHVLPVGIPVTVAVPPGATLLEPVNAEPLVSVPQL